MIIANNLNLKQDEKPNLLETMNLKSGFINYNYNNIKYINGKYYVDVDVEMHNKQINIEDQEHKGVYHSCLGNDITNLTFQMVLLNI